MTISYNLAIASASPLNFFRLLFRWRGSIWKICLKELFVWTIIFIIITFIYRTPYILTEEQKITFEELANYCDTHLDYIPLTFMLGFFVQIIIQRWSVLFQNMGYLENPAIYVGGYIYGDSEECRILRRTIVRYLCLTQVLVFRDISVRVRKRFPNIESIVQAGFMLEHEKEKYESISLKYDKYWVPINWILALIFQARKEGKIVSDSFCNKISDEIKLFRNNIQILCNYDWVPIPLAYPQLVFLAVYTYFAICLVSRQFIITHRDQPNKSKVDMTLPFMTMIEFLIFVGWMKVAEGLLNPFGEDDDDFECNFLLDKNLATSLCIVDDASNDAPELEKDMFWEQKEIEPIYPEHTVGDENNPLIGSAVHAHISTDGQTKMTPRKSLAVDDDGQRRFNRGLSNRVTKSWKKASRHLGKIFQTSRRRSHSVSLATIGNSADQNAGENVESTNNGDIENARPPLRSKYSITVGELDPRLHRRPSNPMTPLSGYDLSKTGSPQKLLSTVTEEDPNNLTIVRIENDQRPSFVDLFVSPESSSTNAHLDSHETPKHIGASSDLASESAGRNIESNVVLTSSNIINATDKSLISGKEMAGSSIPVSPIDDVGGSSQSISADFASWFRVDPPVCNLPAFGGISKHKLTNYGTLRVAFKVRSTNNTHYQFKPVFGIIESLSSTTLQIIRTCGPPGKSRLLILCKEASADVANLASFFRKGPFLGESVIMLNAT